MKKVGFFLIAAMISASIILLILDDDDITESPFVIKEQSINAPNLKNEKGRSPTKNNTVNSNKDNKGRKIELEELSFSEESTLAHISFLPRYENSNLYGLEIVIDSNEFTLEELGFQNGDYITHVDDISIITEEAAFLKALKPHMKYNSVFVTVNRANRLLDLELDLE